MGTTHSEEQIRRFHHAYKDLETRAAAAARKAAAAASEATATRRQDSYTSVRTNGSGGSGNSDTSGITRIFTEGARKALGYGNDNPPQDVVARKSSQKSKEKLVGISFDKNYIIVGAIIMLVVLGFAYMSYSHQLELASARGPVYGPSISIEALPNSTNSTNSTEWLARPPCTWTDVALGTAAYYTGVVPAEGFLYEEIETKHTKTKRSFKPGK